MKNLNSTSYVLLGQLAIKPWSAYDLTKHMGRSILRNFWPRAESHIYDEIKNLASHELATVKDVSKGRRSRLVYSITRKGRQALSAWVAELGKGRIVEWEQLAKVSYADHGDMDQLIAQLNAIRADALERVRHMHTLICETDPPAGRVFPHRAHLGALTGELVLRDLETTLAWLEWVEEEIAKWPDTQQSEAGERAYKRGVADMEKRTRALLDKYGG